MAISSKKVYHLVISYDEETEEINYIEEYVENAKPSFIPSDEFDDEVIDLDPDFWDDEELMSLIYREGIAEA